MEKARCCKLPSKQTHSNSRRVWANSFAGPYLLRQPHSKAVARGGPYRSGCGVPGRILRPRTGRQGIGHGRSKGTQEYASSSQNVSTISNFGIYTVTLYDATGTKIHYSHCPQVFVGDAVYVHGAYSEPLIFTIRRTPPRVSCKPLETEQLAEISTRINIAVSTVFDKKYGNDRFGCKDQVPKINTRYGCWLITALGIVSAVWLRSDVILATSSKLDIVSYWGTVSTLVALVLAIGEIGYSIQTTKSLQTQTAEALKSIRRVEDASTLSDCIAAIDITTHSVNAEKYDAALGAYQHFRKLCVRTIPRFCNSTTPDTSTLNDLSELELKLSSATKVNAAAGLNKQQKHEILKRLLLVKQQVEQHNPANRSQ